MKTSVLSLASAALLVGAGTFAASAQAQQSFQYPQGYVGGDAMFWSLDPDRGSSRDDVGLRLRGGAQFNDYFALEGHLGTGGSDRGADLDHLAGAYAKGIIPVAPNFRLYGLAGFLKSRSAIIAKAASLTVRVPKWILLTTSRLVPTTCATWTSPPTISMRRA